MADDDQDEAAGRIEGPAVQGGGKTVDGEYVGTEIGGGRYTGGAGRGDLEGTGPGGTTGGTTGGEHGARTQGDEWDDDAVDDSGDLDELGESRTDVLPLDLTDRDAAPGAFEDRQDTRDD
jgi:hypothetical protein